MMKKNKEYFMKKLQEKTNRSEEECLVINDILDNHFIIGHNNKEKIKKDFMEKLNVSDKDANELYNIVAELIVKGIFKKEN